jgi:hypothetical protein
VRLFEVGCSYGLFLEQTRRRWHVRGCDIGSRLARWQGPRWRQIHPPTHLWYFSAATIARMLDRFGFEVLSIHWIGVARSVGQIVYSLTSLGRSMPSLLYRNCAATGPSRLTVTLNTFDLILVVARRRNLQPAR